MRKIFSERPEESRQFTQINRDVMMPQGENSSDLNQSSQDALRVPGAQIGGQRVSVPDANQTDSPLLPKWTGCRYSMKAYRFKAICLFLVSAVIFAGAFFLNRAVSGAAAGKAVCWGSALLVLILWAFLLAQMLYRHYTISYKLDHEHLLMTRGFLRQTTDTVLIAQIDDITKIQTLADRLFNGGVGTIEIYANDRSEGHLFLEGIDRPQEAFESLDLLRKDYVRRRGIKSFSSVDSGLDDGGAGAGL